MEFDLDQGMEVLHRTPSTLRCLLADLPEPWLRGTEGPDTWSPFDIVGHLIHGEKTDWIPRTRNILEHGDSRRFEPFDRFAQLETSRGKTLDALLYEFDALRTGNLIALRDLSLTPEQLRLTGRHPEFGVVTLGELLATWVVHDLSHLGQIARVMARQYAGAVGPWKQYIPMVADWPPAGGE